LTEPDCPVRDGLSHSGSRDGAASFVAYENKESAAMNKNIFRLLAVLALASSLSGCFLTKIVTVPMRVVGAVVSIIPVAGNTANDVVQKAANTVDDIPL
jgi:hypothetical protein